MNAIVATIRQSCKFSTFNTSGVCYMQLFAFAFPCRKKKNTKSVLASCLCHFSQQKDDGSTNFFTQGL